MINEDGNIDLDEYLQSEQHKFLPRGSTAAAVIAGILVVALLTVGGWVLGLFGVRPEALDAGTTAVVGMVAIAGVLGVSFVIWLVWQMTRPQRPLRR